MAFKIANANDIPEGKGRIVIGPDGKEIALFKIQGSFYALENACPHMGGPLGEGELDDCKVTCPWHGWQFDIRSGLCENMPGDDARSIPITLSDDGFIYIT